MQSQPIGIFDSGVGGTSVFKEIHQLLPNESIIYLADSFNAPYGNKSAEEIKNLSEKNTRFLISMNCKLIVVACNTATTNAIGYLRSNFNLPFIGIEPAIKPAALQSKTGSIGILATKGTLASDLFHKTTNLYSNNIKVVEQTGTGIVELIESGKLYSEDMRNLLKTYLQPMILANIDHLVLGCTHYPYLIPLFKELLPENVKIIDSGEAVARQTKNILIQNQLLNTGEEQPNISFYTNTNPAVLKQILENKYSVAYKDF
ncbi:glutamate racemase [Paucihalobacter ruber]|uniref:Glutamate racemase n=1 Tax=Paucihalobacter ruber TaxID=2567861 RepID=A0A506PPM5_9FLAO|nr:glutamate racemase [Paucihalobacter ruber]TPV35823.1 glutamate racemase [Paucihalobacter ruber]